MAVNLENIEVSLISILEHPKKPANKKPLIFKASDSSFESSKIVKVDKEKGLIYATVISADDVDTDGEVVSADEVQKACHKFLRNSDIVKTDTNHNLQVNENVKIVESYVDEAGDWKAVIDISGDEELMKSARDGKLTGVSIFGTAEKVSTPAPQEGNIGKSEADKAEAQGFIWSAVSEKLDKIIRNFSFAKNNAKKEEDVMNEEEKKALIEEVKTAVIKDLEEAYELVKKEDKQEDKDNVKSELEKMQAKIDALVKERKTSIESLEKEVKYVDLLADADALIKFQKENPKEYERLKEEYYQN